MSVSKTVGLGSSPSFRAKLKKMPKTVATTEHIEFAIANYLRFSANQIDKKFGTSKGVTKRILDKNGLKVPKELVYQLRADAQKIKFTPEQDQFIKDNIKTMSVKAIAAHIKRCPNRVRNRCYDLGFKELMIQKSINSRFPKGHAPLNKGVRMSDELREKVKHTFFQKGHQPHNTKNDGDISFRQDKRGIVIPHYRVEMGVWIPLKNKVWQDHHGEIPEGYLVVLKDGDNFNTSIENLECISKAENMLRNTIHRYPEDLKKDILKLRKLNRIIKKLRKNGKANS